jgi:hypothetical protein
MHHRPLLHILALPDECAEPTAQCSTSAAQMKESGLAGIETTALFGGVYLLSE